MRDGTLLQARQAGLNWRPEMLALGKPKYLAVVEMIEVQIASGSVRDGDRLPPQRDIADALHVTIGTITKAIREAGRRGIVAARPGSGTFIRVDRTPAAPTSSPFDLSLNVVPTGPIKQALDEAFAELTKEKNTEVLCGYEVATGSERHRRSMASWLHVRGFRVPADRILLTHGSQHALSACFHALTRPSEIVLCEEWTYTGIRRLADLSFVRLESVAMDAEGLDPSSLRDRLKATGAKVVICSAAVQNPTTATMSLERRQHVVAICRQAGAILVEDDIYGHLSGEEVPPLAALPSDNVVHVSSMSKCLAPGFRLGTLTAPEALLPALANALVALHWTAPALWSSLFEVLLGNGAAEACLIAHRAEARRRLDLYAEIVGERPLTTLPSYHVWQALPPPWRSEEFVAELAVEGVRVSPAHHFAVGTTPSASSHVRVCLGGAGPEGLREQLTKFRSTLARPRATATIT